MTRIFPAGHCGAFTAFTDDIAEQHGLDLARPAITACDNIFCAADMTSLVFFSCGRQLQRQICVEPGHGDGNTLKLTPKPDQRQLKRQGSRRFIFISFFPFYALQSNKVMPSSAFAVYLAMTGSYT